MRYVCAPMDGEMPMSRAYYVLWYLLDTTDSYLIWFSNDHDGVVVLAGGSVPCFADEASLHAYALRHQLRIEQETPILHDLDAVARWLNRRLAHELDGDVCLTAWNLFSDISDSIGSNFDSDRAKTSLIYDKLFLGHNLPAFTPGGEHYTPEWDDDEVLIIRQTLAHGLAMFRRVVQPVSRDSASLAPPHNDRAMV